MSQSKYAAWYFAPGDCVQLALNPPVAFCRPQRPLSSKFRATSGMTYTRPTTPIDGSGARTVVNSVSTGEASCAVILVSLASSSMPTYPRFLDRKSYSYPNRQTFQPNVAWIGSATLKLIPLKTTLRSSVVAEK